MPVLYLGLDPGASGALAWVNERGEHPGWVPLDDGWSEVSATVLGLGADWHLVAVLERVAAMPGQGVSSTFKFGASFGGCEALLACRGVPYELVTPSVWQQAMGCRSGGDKNVTKAAAQRLFPGVKVTHRNADALLIAEYCRRLHAGRRPASTEAA